MAPLSNATSANDPPPSASETLMDVRTPEQLRPVNDRTRTPIALHTCFFDRQKHDHTPATAKKSLRTALFLTCVLLLASFIGGLLAHSLALVSEAVRNLTDLFALGLAWFAARQADRPSDEYKTFGYHRVGILAALLNALTFLLIALVICWEAILRFQHPEPVQPFILFGSATIALAINLFIGSELSKEEQNPNIRAAVLNAFADVGASAAMIAAGVIVLVTEWMLVDPLLSVAVALFLAFAAWDIIRETTNILLQAAPKDISLGKLYKDIKKVKGVQALHDLHVWSISSSMPILSCHVLIDDSSPRKRAHILHSLNNLLRETYRIDHATIQLEFSQEQDAYRGNGEQYCCVGAHHYDHNYEDIMRGQPDDV